VTRSTFSVACTSTLPFVRTSSTGRSILSVRTTPSLCRLYPPRKAGGTSLLCAPALRRSASSGSKTWCAKSSPPPQTYGTPSCPFSLPIPAKLDVERANILVWDRSTSIWGRVRVMPKMMMNRNSSWEWTMKLRSLTKKTLNVRYHDRKDPSNEQQFSDWYVFPDRRSQRG
jgi:hypothetical protein